jgi:hypothetical protein
MLQEWHDLITALLLHPDLPEALTDIVVEFGTAAYQSLCDRFLVEDRPVRRADLEQIWRQVGDPTWNAPVYEQFFWTVRGVNRGRPRARRVRVLLGQPAITMTQILAHPHDRTAAQGFVAPLDDHYATVVEQEVLGRGRRALLIAGKGHLLRGLHTDGAPQSVNAATQILQRHHAPLFVVDNLLLPPGPPADGLARRVQSELARQRAPVVAPLAGTSLGATAQRLAAGWLNEMADRALSDAAARYDAQADAVLYFGPGEALTASQPDPALYHWGVYPGQLQRSSALVGAGDQLANGLRWATAGPSWFALLH